jgi:hypothetical protein
VGLFAVWLIGVSVIIHLQHYYPVMKYKDAYQEQEDLRAVGNFDDDKKDGLTVPLPVSVATQIEAGAAR